MQTRREPSRIIRDSEVTFPPKADGQSFIVVQGALCEILGIELFGDLYQYIIRPVSGLRARLYLSRLDKNAWVLRLLEEQVTDERLDREEQIERRM